MKYRVRLTARAERDVDEALAWLCEQGAGSAARRWHQRILAAVGKLERQPERCPLAAESEDLGIELRELIFGRRQGVYRVLFIIERRTVCILHIRHSARDVLRPDEL
jgi:plasmid stabilization system protein ParE